MQNRACSLSFQSRQPGTVSVRARARTRAIRDAPDCGARTQQSSAKNQSAVRARLRGKLKPFAQTPIKFAQLLRRSTRETQAQLPVRISMFVLDLCARSSKQV